MSGIFDETQNFWVPQEYGYELVHPWIVAAFSSAPNGNGGHDTSITAETYAETLVFNVSSDSIRLNNDGAGNLLITIGADTFDLPDFEDGREISGIGAFSADLLSQIGQDGNEAVLTVGLGSTLAAITGAEEIVFSQSPLARTYFLNSITYANGTTESVRNGVRITGTDANDLLRGFDTNDFNGSTYNDTLEGRGGDDSLYGNAGNDVLNGGAGADDMRGG
ncbi:hypothetical protein V1T76_08505, partial [Roseibium sp. FZY0029]|uniref:calcium-binding protein n=1 Tax=Roseibium sp. FZY0029 TaxID=3116647 RepID=UPI002EB0894A|nr:hypothetical protein [Roseibium sp. FZY0029]